MQQHDAAAGCAELGGRGHGRLGGRAAVQCDVETRAGQRERDGAAEPPGAAGDEGGSREVSGGGVEKGSGEHHGGM